MTTGDSLALLGIGLEIVGVLLTAWGFRQTWREFTRERLVVGARPIRFVRSAASRAVSTGGSWWRRIRGLPPEEIAAAGHDSGTRSESATVEAMIGYGPLDANLEVSRAISLLDERTQRLARAFGQEMAARSDGDADARRMASDVDDRLREALGSLDRRTERIAIGGLRTAFAGLGLVLVGLVVQGVGIVVP